MHSAYWRSTRQLDTTPILTGPFAEEQSHRLAISLFLLFANNALDLLVALMKVSDTFSLNFVLLQIFTRRLPFGVGGRVVESLLDLPHLLDVILNLLESKMSKDLHLDLPFEALQELIRLISIVNVAVALPLDMEPLSVNSAMKRHSRGSFEECPFRP